MTACIVSKYCLGNIIVSFNYVTLTSVIVSELHHFMSWFNPFYMYIYVQYLL